MFFKNIFLLEPTSPLRDEKDIIRSFKYINKKKIKTLVSVSMINAQHPNYLSSISTKQKLIPYLKKFKQLRRQDNKNRQNSIDDISAEIKSKYKERITNHFK